MGFLSCTAESTIATCDPYIRDRYHLHRCRLKHRRKYPLSAAEKPPKAGRQFTYDELAAATNGFSADNFLGKGSHGSVYKAVLDGGKLIAAVKRTTTFVAGKFNSGHSPVDNEIEILSRVRNPRLVNLIGFCVDHRRPAKLLVVEFMPNGSLHEFLHSSLAPSVSWNRRLKHALQIARAVHALHSADPPVIHRDIKSSNVLIDGVGNAHLGDFGLSLRVRPEDERVKRTPPAGTLGYLDPAYVVPADLSTKSDVFSFGILLLEIVSGRYAIDLNYSPSSIVDWAVPLIKRGNFEAICDPKIPMRPPAAVIKAICILASRCVRSTVVKRPDMQEVVEYLKFVRKIPNAPPVWNNLRRRVTCLDIWENVIVFEESQEYQPKRARSGTRKQGKVSTVEPAPQPLEPLLRRRNRIMRSRSVGAIGYTRVGPDPGHNNCDQMLFMIRSAAGKKSATVAAVRLNKSRSTGILRSHNTTKTRDRERDLMFANAAI